MRFDERLDRELLRGVLPLCVLAVVATHGPTYGYAITRSLAEAGLGTVKGGTLYPLLQRLEDDGLVTTSWHQGDRGPSRRYYAVTDQGRGALADATSRWDAVTSAATTLVAGASGAPSPDDPSPTAGLAPHVGAHKGADPGPELAPAPGAIPADASPPDPTPTRTPR
ncbi:Transcriptional regulator PadR-like family protein [Cellulosimicrobium cellulans]|uniref:PadR family transcriptional regulator n=1 Tax=Cellulosimicrobium cellulans TaxID=1710 RepID=UPI0008813A12|nr:Transcriptional regulator PadR-like family protein [Cellulosimicrobium cellulans]